MSEQTLEASMARALQLASRGPARGINPRVGCIIMNEAGKTIAEGWHRGAGTPHAEIAALAALGSASARGATVVVTLEPCNHTGLTGPCSQALIDADVARVVYAVPDPGHRSSGGTQRMRAAGIDVTSGVLAAQVSDFLDDWLTAAKLGRPFLTLKWASSLDGRTAANDGSSRWITGTAARQRVHEQRAASDAIVVGTGTILADDPSLTARGDGGELLSDQPIPVVVGTRTIPADAAVFRHPHEPIFARSHDLNALMCQLHDRGIRRAFVEGGPTLASSLVRAELVDEYQIYLAPSLLGGDRLALGDIGVTTIAEQRRLEISSVESLGHDLLISAHPAARPAPDSAHEGAQ